MPCVSVNSNGFEELAAGALSKLVDFTVHTELLQMHPILLHVLCEE